MKNNKYADLIRFGLTQKTLMTLSESSINSLHKNLIEGKKTVCPGCGMKDCKCKPSKKKETKEAESITKYSKSEVDAAKTKGQSLPAGKAVKLNPDGSMDVTNEGEMSEGKKKKSKKIDAFAICTSQLGNEFGTTKRHLWNAKQNNKYERCVKAIKQSMNESRNNEFALILENKILSLVEKHIQPKMKKGDLMNLISKKGMKSPIATLGSMDVTEDTTTAPTKPNTKPGTKPNTKPGTKPDEGNPYKPKTSPPPKAKKSMPSWMSFESIGIKLKK